MYRYMYICSKKNNGVVKVVKIDMYDLQCGSYGPHGIVLARRNKPYKFTTMYISLI